MMKLVMAVINDEDAHLVMNELNSKGFQVTKLASTGGFLRSGNTTVFIGVKKEKVKQVVNIIKEKSKTKKKITVANQPYLSTPEGYIPYPIEVTSGGATIFVLDVEQFEKI